MNLLYFNSPLIKEKETHAVVILADNIDCSLNCTPLSLIAI